jgi:hypothetical protein
MKLKARVLRLEKLKNPHSSGKLTIDVFDRVVNGTITEEEFSRWMPFGEEIFANRESTYEPHAQSI